MFCGEYQHSIDSKNRIILPSKLREELGTKVYLSRSVDKCVSLYTEERWKQFCEKLDTLPDIETRRVKRFMYSTAFETEIDTQGRVLVPPRLCEYASLAKNTTVIGVGDHVEIWDSELYAKECSGERAEDIADILVGLGF